MFNPYFPTLQNLVPRSFEIFKSCQQTLFPSTTSRPAHAQERMGGSNLYI